MEQKPIDSLDAPLSGTFRDPWEEFERSGSIQAYLEFVLESRRSGASGPLPGLPS